MGGTQAPPPPPLATLLYCTNPEPIAQVLVALMCSALEMATAQRTRSRAVVGAPRRAAWQLKSALRHSVSAAPCTIFFFTIIAGDFLFMNKNN